MTDPQSTHTSEPAEGDVSPGRQIDARTPHPRDPAEGKELDEGGADTPDQA